MNAYTELIAAPSEKVDLLWPYPHAHTQRYVFLEILTLIMLKMKINYHGKEGLFWVGGPMGRWTMAGILRENI